MKHGPLIFLAAFFALGTSWFGVVFQSQQQLGRSLQATNLVSQQLYPVARSGQARQGAEVYRANGCFYCHSQQVGQSGTVCDAVLTDAGTNTITTMLRALSDAKPALENEGHQGISPVLPQPVVSGVERHVADAAKKRLDKWPGMKSELHIVPVGPDIARGWGRRRTVAEDYLYDAPVMLGSQRIGPDLANIAARQPDANWQLRHLYAPQAEVTNSTMPGFKFLFEVRKIKKGHAPSSDALQLAAGLVPKDSEVVPKPEAVELVAYLLSLKSNAPLYDAPVSVPATVATPNPTAAQ